VKWCSYISGNENGDIVVVIGERDDAVGGNKNCDICSCYGSGAVSNGGKR